MSLSVARQPILDERGRVFGYELLYRHAPGATSCIANSDLASASVLTGAVLDLGLDTLTNGRQAFLNVTRPLLLGKLDALIPPEGIVIELLETVEIDDEVIDTCRDLRARGYQLALDDFVPGSDAEALLPASCGRSIPPRIRSAPKCARSARHSSFSGSNPFASGRRCGA